MKKKIIKILSLCYALSCLCIVPCFANENTQTLSQKQQIIILIAAFTANGDTERIKSALVQGLENGMTVNEIKEVLIQMYAYSGFPRCLTGLNTFLAVLDERKEQGIRDEMGKDASPLPEHADIREIGAANQTKIIGRPASEGTPSNSVSPDLYAEAFSSVVDFWGTHRLVDEEKKGKDRSDRYLRQ